MLRFEGITKSFGWRSIFRGLRDELRPGVYALQGANGSGKSTLLSILAGAQSADAGEVWIDGLSLSRQPLPARRRVSYVPDESPIYPFMTGRDLLDFVAMAKQTRIDAHVLELVADYGLAPYSQTRFGAMSLGTQKKFMLCAAWIGKPSVLLMDEPSNGLDNYARDVLARLIRHRNTQSVTLFASHDSAFVEASGASIIQLDRLIASAEPMDAVH